MTLIAIRVTREMHQRLAKGAALAGVNIQQYADSVLSKALAQRPNGPVLLRLWREAEGLSQVAAALRLGVSASALCHFEKGDYPPTVSVASRIENATRGANTVPASAWAR